MTTDSWPGLNCSLLAKVVIQMGLMPLYSFTKFCVFRSTQAEEVAAHLVETFPLLVPLVIRECDNGGELVNSILYLGMESHETGPQLSPLHPQSQGAV